MKIQKKIYIQASPENIWSVLTDFSKYGEWNTFISISGKSEPEAELDVKIKSAPAGTPKAHISGVKEHKYLSFTCISGPGNWWYNSEHVFQLKPDPDSDSTEVIHELFCFGLRTKFGRKNIEYRLKSGMEAMNRALGDRVLT